MTEAQEDKIIKFTQDFYQYRISEHDDFVLERYVDYDEEFPTSDIETILTSEHSHETFYEITDDWTAFDWDYENSFWSELENFCEEWNEENEDEDDENYLDFDEARDFVINTFYWTYPDDFLNPEFDAVVEIGGEVDAYSTYRYWTDETTDNYKYSNLYLLANKLGKAEELRQFCLSKGTNKSEDKFVQSAYEELLDGWDVGNSLVFLVRLNLFDAMRILEDKKGTIIFKPTNGNCGLYNGYAGGGGSLEIETEKEVEFSHKDIYAIHTSDFRHTDFGIYSIDDAYGLVYSVWNGTKPKIKFEERKRFSKPALREAKESFSKKLYTFFQDVIDSLKDEGYDLGEPYSKGKYPKEYLSSEMEEIDRIPFAVKMSYEKFDDIYMIAIDIMTYRKEYHKYGVTHKLKPYISGYNIECKYDEDLSKYVKSAVKSILEDIEMLKD